MTVNYIKRKESMTKNNVKNEKTRRVQSTGLFENVTLPQFKTMFHKMIKDLNPKLVTDKIHAHELINKYHPCFSFYWVR